MRTWSGLSTSSTAQPSLHSPAQPCTARTKIAPVVQSSRVPIFSPPSKKRVRPIRSVWPRLAAVAEVLWTEQPNTCLDTLEPRLSAVVANLHRLGVGPGIRPYPQATVHDEMRRRGNDAEALMCVADMLEPMGHYARFMLKPGHTSTAFQDANTPLNRIADTALPDNAIANAFDLAARTLLHAGTSKEAKLGALSRLEAQLLRWQNCSKYMAEHKETGRVGATMLKATAAISVALKSFRDGEPLGGPRGGLFDGGDWNSVFDMDEIRPAILPAAKTLIKAAVAGTGDTQTQQCLHTVLETTCSKCDHMAYLLIFLFSFVECVDSVLARVAVPPAPGCSGDCGLYKGMDIGRGNPAEYQTATVTAAACCWVRRTSTPSPHLLTTITCWTFLPGTQLAILLQALVLRFAELAALSMVCPAAPLQECTERKPEYQGFVVRRP